MVSDAQGMLGLAGDPSGDVATGLGALLGAAALAGRDKLTLLLPPALEPFGLWVEQLVAESTGKSGYGIVPIAGEPLGTAPEYGHDRVVVHVRSSDVANDDADALTAALRHAGTPIAVIDAGTPFRIGAEFARWELATVAAAAVLSINPFDEPNVQQAKDATRSLLESFAREGRLPAAEPDAEIDHAAFTLTAAARKSLAGRPADAFLSVLQSRDYFAVLAYLPQHSDTAAAVRSFREQVRRRTRCATMFGYGPRYLHSTGQLHKGGANNGVFLILTAPGHDVPVPDETFSFGVLELAQALGDLTSLDHVGRRALHVHLPRSDSTTVRRCFDRLLEYVEGPALDSP
jgi:transaldolase / glucose-6-phosphate isomerase